MINKEKFKLSIIIPCYNEKDTIEIIVRKVIQSLNNYKFLNYEIVIVDDCSDDGTIEVLKNLRQNDKIFTHFHEKTSPRKRTYCQLSSIASKRRPIQNRITSEDF